MHRLLESLFEHRVSIVTTSNFKPDDLYPNGLHRDRILPAIELLKAARLFFGGIVRPAVDRVFPLSDRFGVAFTEIVNGQAEIAIRFTPLGSWDLIDPQTGVIHPALAEPAHQQQPESVSGEQDEQDIGRKQQEGYQQPGGPWGGPTQ